MILDTLGGFIVKKPWIIIGIILIITIGFASLIPSLEMETSTDDFLPDTELVDANERIEDYFGQTGDIVMILVERQSAQNVSTTKALKEEYKVIKDLKNIEVVNNSISLVGFVDIMCQLEFGETFDNCTDQQIITAYNDLMAVIQKDEVKQLKTDDPNEKIDFSPYPRLSEGIAIDNLDIKNYFIKTTNETFIFTIEIYELPDFNKKISPPHRKINTWEWYINFANLIVPDKRLEMDYQIAVHIEPTNPLWEIGNGLIGNIRSLFQNIFNNQLKNTYKAEVYLWIKAPDQDISFPLILKTGKINFNNAENRIIMEINKDELGKYGIAPKFGSFELPAKIGNTKAGVRVYKNPIFNKPWSGITVNISYIKNFIDQIQNKPIAKSISTRILNKFGDFSWEDFEELFNMLNNGNFSKESLSLKDLEQGWITLDEAPDVDKSESILFIKPFFLEDLKLSSLIFLSKDFEELSGPSATLIILQLNGSSNGMMDTGESSKEIIAILKESDSRENYVSMKATWGGRISDELNEITEEANMIIVPGIFIVICLILLIMFKRLSYVIIPLVSLSVSMIWIFGTMVFLGISFTTMAVAIVPLLMGLGVDYSVHLFHSYRVELKKGKTPGEAITASIKDVGMAMFLATFTTVIAFLSFLTASIPPLRDFGILCAIGIIYTLITAITLQTSFRYILDRKKKTDILKINDKKISLDRSMEKFSVLVLKQRRLIIILSIVITAVMISGATQVETTFDMNDFLPEGNEAMELIIDIREIFPSSSESQEYILIEGNVASIDTLKGIGETYENLRNDAYVAKTPNGDPKEDSILSIIRNAIKSNSSLVSEFNINSNGIPQNNNDVIRIFDYLYNNNDYKFDVQRVLHKQGEIYDATIIRIYTRITYSDDDTVDTNEQMGILYSEIKNDMENYGDTDVIVTGAYSSMYTIMNSMTESQIISTTISIVLASLVLIIVFRNLILGLITIIPVAICMIWIVGTIYFIGYSFNIMTIMVTSLTIGIGIDYAIHATQRFRLIADRSGNVEKAVSETIGHTGSALFIAAVTTTAGFSMLILAPIPPEQQFGIITSMTIIYSYITSILILPPILMKWGKWRKKRKGYIISNRKSKH